MIAMLHKIIVATFVLITSVACAAFPTPTPTLVLTPTPLPSRLARRWYLVEVVRKGETEPPLTTARETGITATT